MAVINKNLPQDVNKVIITLAHLFIPSTSDLPIDHVKDYVPEICGRYIFEFQKFARWGLLIGIRFFEWCPFFFGFGLKRFTHLIPTLQEKYINDWTQSQWIFRREFIRGIRGLVMCATLSDKEIWKYVNYDPDSHMHEKIQKRKALLGS